jgi:hypothetical protein
MFQFIKQVSSRILANTIVLGAEQYVRSTVEGIVRDRRLAKQAKKDHQPHSR